MSQKVYRSSRIGECLRETLFELIQSGKITEEVAEQILLQFDKSMYKALDECVNAKATLKGNLKTYRYLDNVWQFVLEKLTLKLIPGSRTNSSDLKMDSAKLVCVDSKLVQKENDELELREKQTPPLPTAPSTSLMELQTHHSAHDIIPSILTKTESDVIPGPVENLKDEFPS
eukprot:g7234.t1